MSSKDKHNLSPQAAFTPASSDDEMETSFTSFKNTEKGLTNPLYDARLDYSADSSDAESPPSEKDSLKSKKRKQR